MSTNGNSFRSASLLQAGPGTDKEWLETNGLGGFASSTIVGLKTRGPSPMRISFQRLAMGILCLSPLVSMAQEVVPYAKSEVKVDWVRGTDFSKYKTYAWGTTHQMSPDPKLKFPIADVDAALLAKGLQKVGMDADPSLIAALNAGNKLVFAIQVYLKNPVVKQGTLVIELADPRLKKAVWWGIAEDTLTDDPDKDGPLIQKKISKMFEKYPPPSKK